jgi:hypothetical protein
MGRLNEGQASGGGGDLPPGATRTIIVRDKQGSEVKTITVYRSNRPYAEDLCDAYNASMSPQARERGLLWFVAPSGELRLGDNEAWSRANAKRIESRRETERARFVRHQLEHDPA